MNDRAERLAAIRRLVAERPIANQAELVAALAARGIRTTQATVSRDVAELGLAKLVRGDRHVYVLPGELALRRAPSDELLRRVLADLDVTVARSGLILVLTAQPGTASLLGQAIDESGSTEQVGTVAGDNTLLVLFPDEPALLRWLGRFRSLQASAARTTEASAR